MNHKQRLITGVGLAAGLVAGGGAGLILEATGSAGASAAPAAVAASATTPPTTDGSTGAAAPAPADRTAKLRELLQPLIDDGTLTQAQADAVVAKLGAAPGFGGDHGRDDRQGVARAELDKVATLLGVTTADLRTALQSGTTLADYAVSKGKTAKDVIDLLVADAKAQLDAKVTAGTVTQAEADTRLADATTRITDMVNNARPAGAPGRHRDHHDADDSTSSTPAGTTPAGTTPSPTTPSGTAAPSATG